MKQMDPRKILAFGTGVGIEIGEHDLRVVVVRVRPSGAVVLGGKAIVGFRERPAAEWGREYTELLKEHGASHVAATALLPRREVIVRQVLLPGVADRELGSAIQFQIDSLHPFPEEETRYAWARLRGAGTVLVGIGRRTAIERYASLFAEAGVKIASFTFSAAVLYSAVRLFEAPPAGGFLAIAGGDGEMEFYGESPGRPVFSAVVDSPHERAASLAAAELRLEPDAEPLALTDILPVPRTTPADCDLSRDALTYATALAGACPRPALAANLLPPEYRSSSSRAMFIPTAALALALLLLLGGLVAQARFQDRRYLARLEAEIAMLEPQAKKVAETERSIEVERTRIRLIDDFRSRTKADLDALNDLTRLLAPPAWLNALELTRNSVTLSGETDQAGPLLKVLDGSPLFRGSEFTIPLSRSGTLEQFRIRAVREGVRQ